MDFRTKEGEKANNWFTRSAYDAASGEDWVLVKDDPDPRKRQWVKYDKNGNVVNKKTGALNIGGNLTQWGKGGLKNVGNTVNAAGKLASAFDIRDRVESEKIKPLQELTDNDRVGYLINDLIENAANEEEKNEYLQFKEIHDASLQTKLIFAETGKEATSIIPDDALSWDRRGAAKTAGEAVENQITASAGVQEDKKIQSGVIENQKVPRPLPSITDIEPQYSADPNDKNFKGILSSLEAEGEIDLAAQAKRRKLFEKNRIKDKDRYG